MLNLELCGNNFTQDFGENLINQQKLQEQKQQKNKSKSFDLHKTPIQHNPQQQKQQQYPQLYNYEQEQLQQQDQEQQLVLTSSFINQDQPIFYSQDYQTDFDNSKRFSVKLVNDQPYKQQQLLYNQEDIVTQATKTSDLLQQNSQNFKKDQKYQNSKEQSYNPQIQQNQNQIQNQKQSDDILNQHKQQKSGAIFNSIPSSEIDFDLQEQQQQQQQQSAYKQNKNQSQPQPMLHNLQSPSISDGIGQPQQEQQQNQFYNLQQQNSTSTNQQIQQMQKTVSQKSNSRSNLTNNINSFKELIVVQDEDLPSYKITQTVFHNFGEQAPSEIQYSQNNLSQQQNFKFNSQACTPKTQQNFQKDGFYSAKGMNQNQSSRQSLQIQNLNKEFQNKKLQQQKNNPQNFELDQQNQELLQKYQNIQPTSQQTVEQINEQIKKFNEQQQLQQNKNQENIQYYNNNNNNTNNNPKLGNNPSLANLTSFKVQKTSINNDEYLNPESLYQEYQQQPTVNNVNNQVLYFNTVNTNMATNTNQSQQQLNTQQQQQNTQNTQQQQDIAYNNNNNNQNIIENNKKLSFTGDVPSQRQSLQGIYQNNIKNLNPNLKKHKHTQSNPVQLQAIKNQLNQSQQPHIQLYEQVQQMQIHNIQQQQQQQQHQQQQQQQQQFDDEDEVEDENLEMQNKQNVLNPGTHTSPKFANYVKSKVSENMQFQQNLKDKKQKFGTNHLFTIQSQSSVNNSTQYQISNNNLQNNLSKSPQQNSNKNTQNNNFQIKLNNNPYEKLIKGKNGNEQVLITYQEAPFFPSPQKIRSISQNYKKQGLTIATFDDGDENDHITDEMYTEINQESPKDQFKPKKTPKIIQQKQQTSSINTHDSVDTEYQNKNYQVEQLQKQGINITNQQLQEIKKSQEENWIPQNNTQQNIQTATNSTYIPSNNMLQQQISPTINSHFQVQNNNNQPSQSVSPKQLIKISSQSLLNQQQRSSQNQLQQQPQQLHKVLKNQIQRTLSKSDSQFSAHFQNNQNTINQQQQQQQQSNTNSPYKNKNNLSNSIQTFGIQQQLFPNNNQNNDNNENKIKSPQKTPIEMDKEYNNLKNCLKELVGVESHMQNLLKKQQNLINNIKNKFEKIEQEQTLKQNNSNKHQSSLNSFNNFSKKYNLNSNIKMSLFDKNNQQQFQDTSSNNILSTDQYQQLQPNTSRQYQQNIETINQQIQALEQIQNQIEPEYDYILQQEKQQKQITNQVSPQLKRGQIKDMQSPHKLNPKSNQNFAVTQNNSNSDEKNQNNNYYNDLYKKFQQNNNNSIQLHSKQNQSNEHWDNLYASGEISPKYKISFIIQKPKFDYQQEDYDSPKNQQNTYQNTQNYQTGRQSLYQDQYNQLDKLEKDTQTRFLITHILESLVQIEKSQRLSSNVDELKIQCQNQDQLSELQDIQQETNKYIYQLSQKITEELQDLQKLGWQSQIQDFLEPNYNINNNKYQINNSNNQFQYQWQQKPFNLQNFLNQILQNYQL